MVSMLTLMAMIVAVILIFQRVHEFGFLDGFRPVWLFALLVFPAWFFIPMRSLHVDVRSATAIAVLIALMMQPFASRGRTLLFLSDFLLLLLIVSMFLSNVVNGNLAPLMPVELLRDWLLPYLMGRLFLQSSSDVDRILPVFCWIAVALSVYSVAEGILKVNVIDRAMSKNWSEFGMEALGERWGMKRANGNQSHPIYFGVTLAMLLPWALRAARLASWRRGPAWWRLTPWILCAGMICTGSRSAQVAALCVFAADIFYHHPRYRLPIVLMGLLGALLMATYRDDVVALLSKLGQEHEELEKVKINGVPYDYNGTIHRDLLDVVYKDAANANGWLGYGTGLETMEKHLDPHMENRFKSIDNHYLRFYLQYGIVGLILFGLFCAAAIWNLFPTLYRGSPMAGFCAWASGCLDGSVFCVARCVSIDGFRVGLPVHHRSWSERGTRATFGRCAARPDTLQRSDSVKSYHHHSRWLPINHRPMLLTAISKPPKSMLT